MNAPRRVVSGLLLLLVVASASMCSREKETADAGDTEVAAVPDTMSTQDMIARGKYLVTIGSCHDCHSPKIPGSAELALDESRLLSGSPAGMQLPPVDKKALTPGNWILFSPDLTATVGPWGMSYSANLTPDDQTGIGLWTEDVFISALRSGKHMGAGRPIMPPMPWMYINKMTDDDLRAVFAYLKSLPPISNAVTQPVAPPDVK